MFNTHLQVEFKLRSEFVFSFRIYVILALDCLRQGKRKGESAGGLEDAGGGWGGGWLGGRAYSGAFGRRHAVKR